jgi:hypothetical protein
MLAGLRWSEETLRDHAFHHRVIAGQLRQMAVTQKVGAAIPNVSVGDLVSVHDAQYDGGSHAVLCLVRSRAPLQIGADRAHRLLKSLGQGQIAVRLQEGDEAVDGGLGRLGAALVTADTISYDKQISEGSGGPGDAVLVFGAFPADVALDADGFYYGG